MCNSVRKKLGHTINTVQWYEKVPKIVVDSSHNPSFLYGFLISRNYSLECTLVVLSGHKHLTLLQLTQIHFFV